MARSLSYVNTFDLRGNLVQSAYQKNQNQSTVTGAYSYDATNRMVQGTNGAGETSTYTYNGLGCLVANDMTFANNGYGYHGNRKWQFCGVHERKCRWLLP